MKKNKKVMLLIILSGMSFMAGCGKMYAGSYVGTETRTGTNLVNTATSSQVTIAVSQQNGDNLTVNWSSANETGSGPAVANGTGFTLTNFNLTMTNVNSAYNSAYPYGYNTGYNTTGYTTGTTGYYPTASTTATCTYQGTCTLNDKSLTCNLTVLNQNQNTQYGYSYSSCPTQLTATATRQ